jgi:hypothetical protein
MRFYLKNKKRYAKIWEQIPVPKPNELLAIPVDNRLWHPNLAVREGRIKTPDWYKEIETGEMSLKRCYGLADFLRTGYIMPLWASVDVRRPISKFNKGIDARFAIAESHLFQAETLSEKDMNYYFTMDALARNQFPIEQTGAQCPVAKQKSRECAYLKLVNPWLFRTAPGWSSLFLPMSWEPNSDYQVLAAVIHTDYYPNANLVINILTNNPFRIKEGTPMFHIIPFERKQSMLKTSLIKGDESIHKILKNTGFGTVFLTDEDMKGGYKKQQKEMDRGLEKNV